MSNELTNPAASILPSVENIESKSPALTEQLASYNALAAAVGKDATTFAAAVTEAKKRAAKLFYGIDKSKLYEKDGQRNFKEFCTARNIPYAAAAAMLRYAKANDESKDAFADMSVDNFAAVNAAYNANAAQVRKDAAKLAGMKQSDIKEYTSKVVDAANASKNGKVVQMYYAKTIDGKDYDTPRAMSEWKDYFNKDTYAVFNIPVARDNGGKAMCVVPLDLSPAPFVLLIDKVDTSATPTADAIRDALIRRLCEINSHGKSGVNSGLLSLGYEPLTGDEIAKYGII